LPPLLCVTHPDPTALHSLSLHDALPISAARVFYELYRDAAAFEEHERQEHVRRFLDERSQYLVGPPRVEFLHVQASKGTPGQVLDRKSTRLNSSHGSISYAVFCLKKKIT